MTDTLLQRIVLPIASVEDTQTTCELVLPRLRDGGGDVPAAHAIQKAGGAPDKASVEQRENGVRDTVPVFEETLDEDEIDVETELLTGDTAVGLLERSNRPVVLSDGEEGEG